MCIRDSDKTSLEWLEAVATKRTAKHLFVIIHPPVVPYGARATWHLYAGEKSKACLLYTSRCVKETASVMAISWPTTNGPHLAAHLE